MTEDQRHELYERVQRAGGSAELIRYALRGAEHSGFHLSKQATLALDELLFSIELVADEAARFIAPDRAAADYPPPAEQRVQ